MKTITIRFLVCAAIGLLSVGRAQTASRAAVTNTIRVIQPPHVTGRSIRTSPGQMAPPLSKASAASPFANSEAEMVALPSLSSTNQARAVNAKAIASGAAKAVFTKPTRPGPVVNVSGKPPQVPSPALVAPPARRQSAAGNSEGNERAQSAKEALADVEEQIAGPDADSVRVHSLVAAESADELVDVNFHNTPVVQLLEEYARRTGRTLLTGPSINKTLTVDVVALENQLTVVEMIQAFDIVLNQNGIAVIPIGEKFLLAVPAAQALKEGMPFMDIDAASLPEAPTLITKIIHLEYAEPKDVVNVIQKFAKVSGGITTVESTRMLIIQDYAINLKRMLELIAKIDVSAPANEQIFEIIPIRYAPVSEVADMLGSFTSGGTAFGSARTTGSGSRGSSSRSRSIGSSSNRNTQNSNRSSNSFRPQQSRPPTSIPKPGSAASAFQTRLRNIVASAAGESEPEPLLGNASISYYERNNALLVRGTREEMEKVREMVEQLDQVQPQVLIEAIIIDVSLTDNYEFGINLLQKQLSLGGNSSLAGGFGNSAGGFLSSFTSTNNLPSAISGLTGGFSYYGLLGRNWEAVIRAVETDSFGTVLSRPQILTTHAEPAELFVGETIPFPGSSGIDFSGNSRITIQQVDIGIRLKILPLINPDGLVILEIDQTVESFRGFEIFGDIRAPRTTRREASSKVAVMSGQIIMLGGLISNVKDRTDTGTPFLRKIPIIKHLFKQHTKNSLRSELILMLRPTVLETPLIAQAYAEKAMMELPGVRRAKMEVDQQNDIWMKKADREEERLRALNSKPVKTNKWELPIDLFEVFQEDP